MHQSQQFAQVAPVKKKIPEERWYLQAYSLYRLSDVQGPEELPEIWQTLATLTKEKASPAFERACRESARALRYKSPRVTHAVAVVLLGIHFFTKTTDCANNTVNIFHFPYLSLYVGS